MTFWCTEKQYNLILEVLPLMAKFYRNDILPLFQYIAKEYDLMYEAAEKANNIVSGLHITAANPVKAMDIDCLLSTWEQDYIPVQEAPFHFQIALNDRQRKLLAKTLDVFSRIVMGQLFILFETLDLPENIQDNEHAIQTYHDVYWDGKCGAKEARDLLFPDIRHFGWYGGYGISNPKVAESSRLAYQLARVLNAGAGYILPVTDEPLAKICTT